MRIKFLSLVFFVFFLNSAFSQQTALSKYDGTYRFESFSLVKSTLIEKPLKGAIIFKDGIMEMQTQGSSASYKISSIKDGNIYLEDKSMTHVVKIIPESGSKKGAAYDTKIHITFDKAMSAECDYWCVKQ
jgi:hypothetical protein